MTTLLDQIPREVVHRHICDRPKCKRAKETPAPGQEVEHFFSIDGQEFPWFMSNKGPVISRLRDDLYKISVEILLIDKATREHDDAYKEWCRKNGFESPPYHPYSTFSYQAMYGLDGAAVPYLPVIGGVLFPWLLDGEGCQLDFGHKTLPTLRLSFFANNVISNTPIEDLRVPEDQQEAIWCAGGELIRDGKERCGHCQQLVDIGVGLCEHIEQRHPQFIHVKEDGRKSYQTSPEDD